MTVPAAGGRAPLAPFPGRVRRLGPVLVVLSVLMHATAVWLLLPHGAGRSGVDTPPEIEVEMIDQAAQIRGADPTPPAPQQAPPPRPAPAASAQPASRTPVPLPEDRTGEIAIPTPPTSPAAPEPAPDAPPSPATEKPPGPAAEVHLGGADEDRDPLLVTGDNVVPPQPDARFHNKPPNYPADAARRHAQGTVGLRVHVTEQGQAAWVDLVESSGDESLDRSAQEAVSLWRFQPARVAGNAVPFEYALEIRFRMDGQ